MRNIAVCTSPPLSLHSARRFRPTRSCATARATTRSGCTGSTGTVSSVPSWRRSAVRWATACRPRSPRNSGTRTERSSVLPATAASSCIRRSSRPPMQFGAAIIVLVVNNGMYGTIRMHQERRYPGRVSGTSIENPDFVALARSFGAYAERVSETEGFLDAFVEGAAGGCSGIARAVRRCRSDHSGRAADSQRAARRRVSRRQACLCRRRRNALVTIWRGHEGILKDTPLSGLKVIELARILAGPWAGQTLSDLGADVIKIESPDGDDSRTWGPPFVVTDAGETAGVFSRLQSRQALDRIGFPESAGSRDDAHPSPRG